MKVFQLPDEILRQLEAFSTRDDYHYLLNTSKQYFSRWKKRSIYFTLNSSRSYQYISDPTFRRVLLSKVENGKKQISVIFRSEEEDKPLLHRRQFSLAEIPPIPPDCPVHQIRTPENKQVQWSSINGLGHIESIGTLRLINITIPPIPDVKELQLYGCQKLTNVTYLRNLERLEIIFCPLVEDLSPLRNIPKLTLNNLKKPFDFSMFNCNKQSHLKIIRCSNISNIDNFRMIKKLELINCPKITDVSCLYGVYDLTLISLPNVKDVSGLGGHYRIHLEIGNDDVIGYNSLYNIPHVSLSANLTDISMLRNAQTVKLIEWKELMDITPLANAKEVCFNSCNAIIDISSLRSVSRLRIIQSPSIFSHERMNNNIVEICTNFNGYHGKMGTDFQSFSNVPYLSLTLSPLSEDQFRVNEYLLSFHNLQSLTLEKIEFKIEKYEILGDIPRIILKSARMNSIKCLGRKNRYVELNMCYNIEDVTCLKDVPVVTIIRCPGIKNLEVLANVPRLKVSNQTKSDL